MKIRITDLLDEYLDDDLPLDAMPEILHGESRKPRHPSRKKRWAQVVAAVLIVGSVSVAGGVRMWCGSGIGNSLSVQAVPTEQNVQTAERAPADAEKTTPEPTEDAAYTEDTPITDGGYITTTISAEGDGLNIGAGDVSRDGVTYSLKITIDAPFENVTGFLLDEYDAYLVLADGTVEELSSSSETSYQENPFVKTEVFSFDYDLSEAELEMATLYIQISSVIITTTDYATTMTGRWDMSFSESGVAMAANVIRDTESVQALPEGQDFTVTDLEISATGCTFWLHTDADQFTLVPRGQLALAVQQDNQRTYYGLSILTDESYAAGTITIDSTTMSTRGVTDTQNLVYCTITWKEVAEPTSIIGLYFTDGSTEQTVEATAYSY